MATLVSGPRVTRVSGSLADSSVSTMNAGPAIARGSTSTGVVTRSARPSWPCTISAVRTSRRRGATAPGATGTSRRPMRSRTLKALAVPRSTSTFPWTTVMPATSSSGERSASMRAMASSMPGSVSMRTRTFGGTLPCPRLARRAASRYAFPMPITPARLIWMDGELVPWEDAKIHVLSHVIHYGTGVFEGIRCYETPRGPAVFRLTDHLRRLYRSAAIYRLTLPYSLDELIDACKEAVRANELTSCYIRPVAFHGYGEMGVNLTDQPAKVFIAAWPWGSYLGDDCFESGVRLKVSSWR